MKEIKFKRREKKENLPRKSKKKNLKWKKRIFPILGLVLGLFLIIYPFSPQIIYFFQNLKGNDAIEIPYESVIAEKIENDDSLVEIGKPIPEENTLVIPKIDVDVIIVEGAGEDSLLRGAWHRPGTGDPVNGGNYVVTGHRFRYLPPNNTTFYNLDKLEEGDLIIVYYEGKEYDYQVDNIFEANPEDLYVEDDYGYDLITLYTCTPLWTSTKRLVVQALPL